MRFLPPDSEVILYETVFEGDLLGRNKISQRLSNVLDRINDPLVIALDGRWGTGKSFFLKRWVGAHRLQNSGRARTVYFDAFAHDYLSDPLISLVSAIANRSEPATKSKLDAVKKVAFKLIKPTAKVALAISTFGATQALNELGDAAAEAIGAEANNALDKFWEKEQGRQQAFAEFHSALRQLTVADDNQPATPLIIVIDELDRCRPDYALEVLEVIKHFFAVPNVHFVLGVNLFALENSVKARYGTEVDSTAYLHKFISFTISLPDHIGDEGRTPATLAYVRHLGQLMETPPPILSEVAQQLKFFTRANHVSIREVGKILSAASLLPDAAVSDKLLRGWRAALVTLLILKVLKPVALAGFVAARVSAADLKVIFGVEDKLINRPQGGLQNPDYDHQLFILYSTWLFLVRDDSFVGSDVEKHIAGTFSQFGDLWNVKGIPQKIYDEWLSDFRT